MYKDFSIFMTSIFEGAFFGCILVMLLMLGFFVIVFIKVWYILRKPLLKSLLSNYVPKTGDILMSQWRYAPITSYIPFVKYFPTHVGIVWNRKKTDTCDCLIENKDEIYILEMNHFRGEKNYYTYSQNKKKGLRVIKYYDFIDNMEGILYTRKIKDEILSIKIENALNTIQEIYFEPRVSNMNWESTFAIGWVFVLPNISRMCSYKLKFDEKQYPTIETLKKYPPTFFCSEFIIWFLQILGYINIDFKKYYTFSPGCFLSFTKKLDNLQENNVWYDEEILLKRY